MLPIHRPIHRWITSSGLLAALLSFQGAFSATIDYSLTDLGGNRFEVEYAVTNDLAVDIEQVSVYFDVFSYENLQITTPLADWDELVLQPALTPPFVQDGLYDALALGSGIPTGTRLGGFSLSFDWLGSGTPGSQYFEISDPTNFQVLDSGHTRATPPANAVAVPATSPVAILLAMLLMTGTVWARGVFPLLPRRRGSAKVA
jgi:hypothetical protein